MSDESHPEESAAAADTQTADTQPEAQRHFPSFVTEAAHQLADGSLKAAAGYAVGKAAEKVFGGHGKDRDSGTPDPPADPPPSQAE
jgi:hypothetical protein